MVGLRQCLKSFCFSLVPEKFYNMGAMEISRQLLGKSGRPRLKADPLVKKAPKVTRNVADQVRGPRGEQIYDFRKCCGWSRDLLAAKMRVHVDSIIDWEFGQFEPTEICWWVFCQIRKAQQRKLRRKFGIALDGGPVMEK